MELAKKFGADIILNPGKANVAIGNRCKTLDCPQKHKFGPCRFPGRNAGHERGERKCYVRPAGCVNIMSEEKNVLQKNEAILLNEIIGKIYTTSDYRQMRFTLLEMLDTLIPYSTGSFYLASKEKGHCLDDPVGRNIPQSELQRYLDEYEDKDYTRWFFTNGKSMVYRETDFFSDKVRQDNEFYKDIYIPAGIYFSAQISIAHEDAFMGIISLYRSKEEGDFTENEIFMLELLKDHLNNRAGLESEKPGSAPLGNLAERYKLTAREAEVMRLMHSGASNKTICEALVISPNTLKKHSMNIYKKFGVNRKWELVNMLHQSR